MMLNKYSVVLKRKCDIHQLVSFSLIWKHSPVCPSNQILLSMISQSQIPQSFSFSVSFVSECLETNLALLLRPEGKTNSSWQINKSYILFITLSYLELYDCCRLRKRIAFSYEKCRASDSRRRSTSSPGALFSQCFARAASGREPQMALFRPSIASRRKGRCLWALWTTRTIRLLNSFGYAKFGRLMIPERKFVAKYFISK